MMLPARTLGSLVSGKVQRTRSGSEVYNLTWAEQEETEETHEIEETDEMSIS